MKFSSCSSSSSSYYYFSDADGQTTLASSFFSCKTAEGSVFLALLFDSSCPRSFFHSSSISSYSSASCAGLASGETSSSYPDFHKLLQVSTASSLIILAPYPGFYLLFDYVASRSQLTPSSFGAIDAVSLSSNID